MAADTRENSDARSYRQLWRSCLQDRHFERWDPDSSSKIAIYGDGGQHLRK
jgi:hypothetical protein